MTALASYIRHVITATLLVLVTKLNLPEEGSAEAIHFIANAVVLTLSWVAVKYTGPWLKKVGILKILLLLSIPTLFLLQSCTIDIGPDGKPVIKIDPVRANEIISDKTQDHILISDK